MPAEVVITAQIEQLPTRPLADLAQAFPTLRYVWFDLDGPHYGHAPTQAPSATHLWGWDERHALLARLDTSTVIAAVLLRKAPAHAQGVPLVVRPLMPWAPNERRVAHIPEELAAASLITLEAPGPVEFLADDRWTTPLPGEHP